MPRLTARALAELIDRPAYDQLRILREQKYPRREPQIFRTPYYSPAAQAISQYYRAGNDDAVLAEARRRLSDISLGHKRRHNARVIDAFEASGQQDRLLTVRPSRRFSVELGTVSTRLSPDLLVHEDGDPKVIYYNYRADTLDDEFARRILEVAHWILEENDAGVRMRDIELIDLSSDRLHSYARRRKSTIDKVRANVQVIESLWETL